MEYEVYDAADALFEERFPEIEELEKVSFEEYMGVCTCDLCKEKKEKLAQAKFDADVAKFDFSA